MAGFFDSLNQGLTQLSQSPVGMAGMGLLMMPSQSLTPINPWEYAAQGMNMGVQNRQRAQALAAQEEQNARDYARYVMEANNYQAEFLERQTAQAQKERLATALDEYKATMEPGQRLAFDALPLSEQTKIVSRQAFPTTPEDTTLARNLQAAGLQPRTKEYQKAMMAAVMRPPVSISTERPLSISDVARLEGPGGEQAPLNITAQEAAAQGFRPRTAPPTEGQSVSAGFYQRMANADAEFSPEMEQVMIQPKQVALSSVPGVGNYLVDENYQVAKNLQEDFVTANLRKESGAVIGAEEMNREITKYFPQLGDKPEVIARKRKLRQTAINAMRSNAGRAIPKSIGETTTPAGTPVTPNFAPSPTTQDLLRKYGVAQ